MATLIVRQVDDRVLQALKEKAKRNHRSAEAEHRAILQAALGLTAPSTVELLAFFKRGGELGLAEAELGGLAGGGTLVAPICLDDDNE